MPSESAKAVTIAADGHPADVESLWDWLRREPELRGHLRTVTRAAPDGSMGSGVELEVVASAPALAALTRSIPIWLSQREIHSKTGVTVTVTAPDGRAVSLTVNGGADTTQLLRDLLGNL